MNRRIVLSPQRITAVWDEEAIRIISDVYTTFGIENMYGIGDNMYGTGDYPYGCVEHGTATGDITYDVE
jgi:hypothetical protein